MTEASNPVLLVPGQCVIWLCTNSSEGTYCERHFEPAVMHMPQAGTLCECGKGAVSRGMCAGCYGAQYKAAARERTERRARDGNAG